MLKVLVVDDDKLVRKGLISAMPWERFGMQVVGEANNGRKALEFIESADVDLLLTDLAMPVMSGIELMREVRVRFPGVHIVVLTLHQDFEYVQEALRLGAVDYIAKVELEQEVFDEVLERISRRIRELEGGRKAGRGDEGGEAAANETDRAGGHPDERAREEQERPAFYERRANEAGSRVPADDVEAALGLQDPEEGVKRLRSEWTSYGWIHQDAAYDRLTGLLHALRLPQPRLIGLLYSLADHWNRLFQPVYGAAIELGEPFDYWYEAEEWLRRVRETLRRAMGKSAFSQEVFEAVMKAVDLIHEEAHTPLTAADVAKRVNMSRSYFSQCFKDIVGSTFNDYIRHVRMDKAKNYLLQTSKPIHWIAEHTGYSDEKYFSRTFREHTGLLPSEYRQTFRTGGESSAK
ncbi:response regulator [Paenibacillus hamazuiensis]|uniref:response regulator n=1 Tax=Paenibacillus hamazuiensis TaxID=2936508 RepID=UPI00200D2CD4|nr:response regulator [Paenibacillus hamazuiensis]